MAARLFHFTCAHGYQALGRRGELWPIIEHPFLYIKVVWLTTEEWPDRERTGLGMTYTRCDRMQYRYMITDLSKCRRWLDSPDRATAPQAAVADLEGYGDPEHWWIASDPVPARLA